MVELVRRTASRLVWLCVAPQPRTAVSTPYMQYRSHVLFRTTPTDCRRGVVTDRSRFCKCHCGHKQIGRSHWQRVRTRLVRLLSAGRTLHLGSLTHERRDDRVKWFLGRWDSAFKYQKGSIIENDAVLTCESHLTRILQAFIWLTSLHPPRSRSPPQNQKFQAKL